MKVTMTVKEVIEKLSQFNPENEVKFIDDYGDDYFIKNICRVDGEVYISSQDMDFGWIIDAEVNLND